MLITGLTRCEPKPDCDAFMRERALVGRAAPRSIPPRIIDGVSGQPRLGDTYDKHRLVPFGEFIPLWDLVSQFNIAPLQQIGAGFEAGPPPVRMILPEAPPAVVLICYEAIFPGLIPREGRAARLDCQRHQRCVVRRWHRAWQHYAMARYRAIEEGIPSLALHLAAFLQSWIFWPGSTRDATSDHVRSGAIACGTFPYSLLFAGILLDACIRHTTCSTKVCSACCGAAGTKNMNDERAANAVDRRLGQRVRTRRLEIGMSQEKLAETLGVTFQQVQKYEKGVNRIAASRLFDIAASLRCPSPDFSKD